MRVGSCATYLLFTCPGLFSSLIPLPPAVCGPQVTFPLGIRFGSSNGRHQQNWRERDKGSWIPQSSGSSSLLDPPSRSFTAAIDLKVIDHVQASPCPFTLLLVPYPNTALFFAAFPKPTLILVTRPFFKCSPNHSV